MCISAPASIVTGSLLSIAGVLTIRQVNSKRLILFAAIPLIFAAQQFTEAIVWLSFDNPAYAAKRTPAVLAFLAFAQVLWPIYVPLSVYISEYDRKRKKIILIPLIAGLIFSAYLLWGIAFFPVSAEIANYHIRYEMYYPNSLALAGSIAYFTATVIPLFISSMLRVRLLAMAILISFLISKLYFADSLISVWCFFAAIASVLIFYIIKASTPAVVFKQE